MLHEMDHKMSLHTCSKEEKIIADIKHGVIGPFMNCEKKEEEEESGREQQQHNCHIHVNWLHIQKLICSG